jgi:superfamily I DNA/RNA helicase
LFVVVSATGARLQQQPTAGVVVVKTFHSVCLAIVRRKADVLADLGLVRKPPPDATFDGKKLNVISDQDSSKLIMR